MPNVTAGYERFSYLILIFTTCLKSYIFIKLSQIACLGICVSLVFKNDKICRIVSSVKISAKLSKVHKLIGQPAVLVWHTHMPE